LCAFITKAKLKQNANRQDCRNAERNKENVEMQHWKNTDKSAWSRGVSRTANYNTLSELQGHSILDAVSNGILSYSFAAADKTQLVTRSLCDSWASCIKQSDFAVWCPLKCYYCLVLIPSHDVTNGNIRVCSAISGPFVSRLESLSDRDRWPSVLLMCRLYAQLYGCRQLGYDVCCPTAIGRPAFTWSCSWRLM